MILSGQGGGDNGQVFLSSISSMYTGGKSGAELKESCKCITHSFSLAFIYRVSAVEILPSILTLNYILYTS
jgi:hypothetical protein